MIHENNPGHFVAEASDIGLAVGIWPTSFEYNGHIWRRYHIVRDRERKIVSVEYVTITGDIAYMTVFND